jgi:cyclophilin family peptidyl-prolyl cis-trans isomerase
MKKQIIRAVIFLLICTGYSCAKTNKPLPPRASFSYYYIGYTVYFTNTSQTYGASSTYTWNFGDFSPLKMGENQEHPYGGSGIKYVSLTVSNAYGYDKYQANVEIKEEIAQIATSFGVAYLWLYNQTPVHKSNFLHNAYIHYYDGTTFHKIVSGEMVMGGDYFSKDTDPNNDGLGGSVNLAPEFVDTIKNVYGSVGAVRPPDNIDPQKYSNSSQFYIVTNSAGYPQWDGNHTVFGRVIKGMDVVNQIASQNADSNGRPLTDIRMTVNILYQSKAEILQSYGYKVP